MFDRRVVAAAGLLGLLLAAPAARAADEGEQAAQAAAESWLRLVDGGAYAASWDQAAGVAKEAVKQGDWAEVTKAAREPLGALRSRKLKSREQTDTAPRGLAIGGRLYARGGGKYVVLQFEAAFAGKPAAVETVVATLDRDGAWRVCSYAVR